MQLFIGVKGVDSARFLSPHFKAGIYMLAKQEQLLFKFSA